jgi:cytoskeletal protein CcmA (bactofilin family)
MIGKGMIIKGLIHSEEDVFLNGEMEGDLDIANCRLTIGPDGKVAANARAREVDISGVMTGNVETAERTCIRASGQLTGDIKTGGIVIEAGALFKGRVEIIAKPQPAVDMQKGDARNGEAKVEAKTEGKPEGKTEAKPSK